MVEAIGAEVGATLELVMIEILGRLLVEDVLLVDGVLLVDKVLVVELGVLEITLDFEELEEEASATKEEIEVDEIAAATTLMEEVVVWLVETMLLLLAI